MKTTTEQYSWYKFARIVEGNLTVRQIVYAAIRAKKITIEDLFILSAIEFQEIFPQLGKGEFADFSQTHFQIMNAAGWYKEFQNFRDDLKIVPVTSPFYPKKIKQRMGLAAPPILYCIGHLPLLNAKNISIIGSEEIGKKEISLIWQLATYFARMGYNVTSTHSAGVGEHAHKAALRVDGTTSAVLPNGLGGFDVRVFIREYGWEYNSVFVSPFLPNKSTTTTAISRRNALTAAWSDAIVVITSDRNHDPTKMTSNAVEIGLTALTKNIPVFVPPAEQISFVSFGNVELEQAGAIEFHRPKQIIDYLVTLKK